MHRLSVRLAFVISWLVPSVLLAQGVGKFPPDSLVNTQVIAHGTPVMQVVGQMRNFTGALGVRCQFCHVGEEGMPLDKFDFASDQKRTKLVARQMMRMVAEINRRLDTLPGRTPPGLQVSCNTCHRGTNRPVPLATIVADAANVSADSAVRAYRALRERYYGKDTFDFTEFSLNSAALRVGRASKFAEAFSLIKLNEEFFPTSSAAALTRGNVELIRGDTTAAEAAFREAVKRDPNGGQEAKGRLRDIGKTP
ncbi:MAG: c-type cytochrome [Gemmatimonadales bacterium]